MRKLYWIGGLGAVVLAIGAAATGFTAKPAPSVAAPKRAVLLAPPASHASVATLVAATKTNPGDAAVWADLGNAHLAASALPDAITAYRKALAIDPTLAVTWSALGEALIQTARSDTPAMPVAAKDAFTKTLALDPQNLRARFYMTMERDFSGQHDRAVGEWLAMLREAPMGSDADEAIRAALAASINRNLAQVKAAMAKATQVQPRVTTAPTKG